jgi:hypothetical protein
MEPDIGPADEADNPQILDIVRQQYGRLTLLQVREILPPTGKPREFETLKKLIGQAAQETAPPHKQKEKRSSHGKQQQKQHRTGRTIEGLGTTELTYTTQKGQWWRNIQSIDVIIRESFLLTSPEVGTVSPGPLIQQSDWAEVFVTGEATGIVRMPVHPDGWVTVDATPVGGPKYLELANPPRWKAIFKSGCSRGDIVVRESMSIDSDEVATLLCGTIVEQVGPQQRLEDGGAVRMPIEFPETAATHREGARRGWVTCDATACGGPKFFERCAELASQRTPNHKKQEPKPSANPTWNQNRWWRLANMDEGLKPMALVRHAEPFPPTGARTPDDSLLLRWVNPRDVVEQVGHSKKVKGYLVMPVRVLKPEEEPSKQATLPLEGWVTRCVADKGADKKEYWFEELVKDEQGWRLKRGS